MKTRLTLGILCAALSYCLPAPLYAQPPVLPTLRWPVKAGNPRVIETPKDWTGSIAVATYSPDGATLATGGGSWNDRGTPKHGLILLWDAQTGAPKGELHGHREIVYEAMFSPDGKLLASQSLDGMVFLWEVASRALRHRFGDGNKTPGRPRSPSQPRLHLGAWSPDGKTLATYEASTDQTTKIPSYTIKLFDADSGQLIRSLTPRQGMVRKIAWAEGDTNLLVNPYMSANGQFDNGQIELVDGQNGNVLKTLGGIPGSEPPQTRQTLNRETQTVQFVSAFSTDSRYALFIRYQIAPGARRAATDTVLLWDLQNDRAVWTKTVLRDTMKTALFSRGGKTLVAGSVDNEIVFYDAATSTVQQTFPTGGCTSLSSLTLSPDARHAAYLDRSTSATYIRNLDQKPSMPQFTSRTVLNEIYQMQVLNWRGDEVSTVTRLDDYGPGPNFDFDTRTGRELRFDTWNAATGHIETRTIPEKRVMGQVTLSPDGTRLAVHLSTRPKPGTLQTEGIGIYDVQAGQLLRLLPEKNGIAGMAWSPDGKTLATHAYQSTTTLWNPETGDQLRTLHTKANIIAWSPDGSLIAAGSDRGDMQLFDPQSGQEKQHWPIQGSVHKLAFAPDSKTLAVGVKERENTDVDTSTVRLIDIGTGQEKRRFNTQPALLHIHWTPDGSGIAASSILNWNRSSDGQLRLWDAATGQKRIAIDDPCGMQDFAFSPDGNRVATYNRERVRVWELK